MKQPYCLFLLFLLSALAGARLHAQVAPIIPSSVAIANASVAQQSEWSAFGNTAALAYITSPEASMLYENRFMLPELGTRSLQAGLNTSLVNVGIAFAYHGYSVYNEMIGGLALARNFGDRFSMGMQFNYYAAYFSGSEENRYRGTILTQFGLSSKLFPKLSVGFHTFNPFQSSIKTDNTVKRIPSVFSLGACWDISEDLLWLSQVDKEAGSTFRFATGFEYDIMKQLTLKLGAYGYDYLIPALGFGLHFGRLHFYLNGEMHPRLGLNTLGCLKYRFYK